MLIGEQAGQGSGVSSARRSRAWGSQLPRSACGHFSSATSDSARSLPAAVRVRRCCCAEAARSARDPAVQPIPRRHVAPCLRRAGDKLLRPGG